MKERRVLKIPRGQAKEHLETAKAESCPELQEVDGLEKPEVYIELIPDPVNPVDWRSELAKAKTVDEKVDIITRMLSPGQPGIAGSGKSDPGGLGGGGAVAK